MTTILQTFLSFVHVFRDDVVTVGKTYVFIIVIFIRVKCVRCMI
jgi:hypothetical protein